jgi:hypothetical protein
MEQTESGAMIEFNLLLSPRRDADDNEERDR